MRLNDLSPPTGGGRLSKSAELVCQCAEIRELAARRVRDISTTCIHQPCSKIVNWRENTLRSCTESHLMTLGQVQRCEGG